MKLSDFDYELPESLIAQEPLAERDASRLLVLDRTHDDLHHSTFNRLADWLPSRSVLVINDTKVMRARLTGSRAGTGGRAELLLVQRIDTPHDPLAEGGWGRWECLIQTSKKLKPDQQIVFETPAGSATATILEIGVSGVHIVALSGPGTLAALLAEAGAPPLPPYIRRPEGPHEADTARYQTVYAERTGAVAAPTAGLHFTPDLLDALRAAGHRTATLTLHVGPGTFLPVRSEDLDAHQMHAEPFEIPEETAALIESARAAGDAVVAVGTTACRALEAAATPTGVQPGRHRTDLFIRPGYTFGVVNALITNFHLPRSTLLMLVSALAGRERILHAYREAIAHDYRFYSYGDAMLIR